MNRNVPGGVNRRSWTVAAAASLIALPTLSRAQGDYPNKPIRLIVPFATGGVADLAARLVAEQMSKRIGQNIVVDNRPGAGGNMGSQMVAAAEPDGYTLLLGHDGPMAINPHVYARTGFDPVKDFQPVGKIGDVPVLIVANPSVAAKTMPELIALSKSTATGLSYGSAGTGSPQHLLFELINQRTGSRFVHVPYKGGAPAILDVIGGHIPLAGVALAGALDHVKSGRMKPIAISSAQRSKFLPEVPTLTEGNVDIVLTSWNGLMAPSRTPRPIVERLNAQLNLVLADPEVRAKLDGMGLVAAPGSPEAFAAQISRDLARYAGVVKAARISAE